MNLKIRNATTGRIHRSFDLGSTPTIGVDPGEPFDLLFTNSDPNDVEIRVTLDGIDILTGKPADLSTTGERFIVHGYETMTLSAWPESMQGGARFVFAEQAMGVARHTIGEDKAHVGIIAVAVFREGARRSSPSPRTPSRSASRRPVTRGMGVNHDLGEVTRGGSAVGAGQHVGQQLVHAKGLREPTLHMTLVLRHMWNDDLRGLVRDQYTRRHLGFPGETKFTGVNLSGVPRVGGYPEPGFGQYGRHPNHQPHHTENTMAILTTEALHKRRATHQAAIVAIDAELLHRGAPTAIKPDVATTPAKRGTNFSRAEILAMLAEGPKLLREIATLFGDRVTPANANQLSTMLWRMTTAGQIRKLADGRYRRVKRSS